MKKETWIIVSVLFVGLMAFLTYVNFSCKDVLSNTNTFKNDVKINRIDVLWLNKCQAQSVVSTKLTDDRKVKDSEM